MVVVGYNGLVSESSDGQEMLTATDALWTGD